MERSLSGRRRPHCGQNGCAPLRLQLHWWQVAVDQARSSGLRRHASRHRPSCAKGGAEGWEPCQHCICLLLRLVCRGTTPALSLPVMPEHVVQVLVLGAVPHLTAQADCAGRLSTRGIRAVRSESSRARSRSMCVRLLLTARARTWPAPTVSLGRSSVRGTSLPFAMVSNFRGTSLASSWMVSVPARSDSRNEGLAGIPLLRAVPCTPLPCPVAPPCPVVPAAVSPAPPSLGALDCTLGAGYSGCRVPSLRALDCTDVASADAAFADAASADIASLPPAARRTNIE